jgi:hypothetical protein
MSLRFLFVTSCLVLSSAGCGSSQRSSFDGASGASTTTPPPDGNFGASDAGATKTGPDGCSDAAKLVYVVDDAKQLYSFEPALLRFTKIGKLACPTTATPNSMAVDRSGTAWVNMSDGTLFKASTADASCSATPFQPNQQGFVRFGMAFASDTAGGTSETLYVVGINDTDSGKGLAKIDLTTFVLTTIGDFSGALKGKGAELTGTGNGKLYGFFTTSPATLAEIDKTTGATSNERKLDGVDTGSAWAFSFWGGDFWFYTAAGSLVPEPSKVTQLRASSDDALQLVRSDVGGFRIVGAGVSTCAPTSPVK